MHGKTKQQILLTETMKLLIFRGSYYGKFIDHLCAQPAITRITQDF
jgi:hypothetical protein